MLEQYTISDIRQLKALSHASRVKILSSLAEKPMTAKQLADLFGEEPAKTSYHVKQLLKVGLVELKFTRETQNSIVEKYYQAIAKDFQTDPYLARRPGALTHLEAAFLKDLTKSQSDFLRACRSDVERSTALEGAIPTTAYGLYRLEITPELLPAFLEEIQQLAGKYRQEDGGYRLQVLLYPEGDKQKILA